MWGTVLGFASNVLGLTQQNNAAVSTFSQLFGMGFLQQVGGLRTGLELERDRGRGKDGSWDKADSSTGSTLPALPPADAAAGNRQADVHSTATLCCAALVQVKLLTGGAYNYSSWAQLQEVNAEPPSLLGEAATVAYNVTVSSLGVQSLVAPQFNSTKVTNAIGVVLVSAGERGG